jgi:uncharacterized membrane protein
MWHAHNGMGWWMIFGGVFWLVFLATVVWLMITLLSPGLRADDPAKRRSMREDAREIARQRYARGEIDRDEYRQIILDLDAPSGGAESDELGTPAV